MAPAPAPAPGRTRRWPRNVRLIVVRVAMFLLLGAVVNVAVAWGFTLFGKSRLTSVTQMMSSTGAETRPFPWVDHALRDQYDQAGWWEYGVGFQTVSIAYCDWSATNGGAVIMGDYLVQRYGGWPSIALEGECHELTRVEWGIVVPIALDRQKYVSPLLGSSESTSFVPLKPIWPGFAINTVFYAAILWLLFAFPFALRRWRRIKRGLCAKCAYPVGASDVCTECGAMIASGRRPALE